MNLLVIKEFIRIIIGILIANFSKNNMAVFINYIFFISSLIMITKIVHNTELIYNNLVNSIIDDVKNSLNEIYTINNKFIINDTKWYWKNTKNKLSPSVVNSAKYLSSHFQNNLLQRNWEIDKTIDNQEIDGFKIFDIESELFKLDEENYIELLTLLKNDGYNNYGIESTKIYKDFVKKGTFKINKKFSKYKKFFTKVKRNSFNVGLEFETGNIASSFRAMQKLDGLYQKDFIDIGIFVTAIDKYNCSTRIWPQSNRNGSFEELLQRNYYEQREYLALDIGFEPDGFSDRAPYLGDDGELYEMQATGKLLNEGYNYEEFLDNSNQIKYKRIISV